MPSSSGFAIEAAPSDAVNLPIRLRGPKLRASGTDLVHVYETDTKALSEADWVYLSVVCSAYQIHPATVAQLAALGPVGGDNAKRWTIEGPLCDMPDDPGAGNCTIKAEIAYSLGPDPGSDWKPYEQGRYRLRSVKARVTVTRPTTHYQFRITQLGILATRISAPQRARRVASGVSDVIPAGMCRVISHDFEVIGSLEVEADARLEILS